MCEQLIIGNESKFNAEKEHAKYAALGSGWDIAPVTEKATCPRCQRWLRRNR